MLLKSTDISKSALSAVRSCVLSQGVMSAIADIASADKRDHRSLGGTCLDGVIKTYRVN